jgi:hypothetical protein
MTDRQRYYQEAETVALTGLTPQQSLEAKPLVQQIVDNWLRQADEAESLDREDLVEIGLEDLRNVLSRKVGDARLATLHAQALKPAVQQTSGHAFDLAKQVADGKTTKQNAAKEAARLQERIHRLLQQVKALQDEDYQRLFLRDLADADLEARYVLEDKDGAISIRLNRHING